MSAPSDPSSAPLPPLDLDSSQQAAEPPLQPGGGSRASITHVRGVIREQFAAEVSYKEEELEKIEERIHLAKMMLQRLRLGVLAQHYGVAAFYPTALDYREETIGEQHNWETFEEELVSRQDRGADSTQQDQAQVEGVEEGDGERVEMKEVEPDASESSRIEAATDSGVKTEECEEESWKNIETGSPERMDSISVRTSLCPAKPPSLPPPPPPPSGLASHNTDQENSKEESRFYFKKRIIVGNTSQYLDPTAHNASTDGSTHKWMVYVRGSQVEPDISHFVKAVRFFLHPSYHPNDIVRVHTPPFHLTRLGWGEFPVRVQLEFSDKANKSIDIIHNLVLDRTHTGQQTLGAETLVDLDIVAPPPEEGGGGRGFWLNGLSATCTTVRHEGEERGEGQASPAPLTPLESPPSSSSGGLSRPLSPDIPMQTDHQEVTPTTSTNSSSSDPLLPPPVGVASGVFTTNLDKCLHNAVRAIPIYGKPNPAEDFYIPAPSLAQFKCWHVGRRRATEWERAVAIKRSIQKKLKVPSLLSTKQIMQWCRQNGYTPLDPIPASGRGFCKVCGCQLEAGLDRDDEEWAEEMEGGEVLEGVARRCPEVHEHCQLMMFGRQGLPLRGNTMDPFEELHPDLLSVEADDSLAPLPKLCSLSEPHNLVGGLFSQQASLEDQAKKQEEDVDICALPASPSCARSRALVDMVPRFRVPQTPELKWVQQTAASIGIHIYPAVIDRMYAHVVEHMIYISCARFLRGILGQAVQGAGQILEGKLSQDRVLTPFHVQQAFLKLEHCDFLTNRHFGVCPPPRVGVAERGSARSSSAISSCSDSSEDEETGTL